MYLVLTFSHEYSDTYQVKEFQTLEEATEYYNEQANCYYAHEMKIYKANKLEITFIESEDNNANNN